MLGKFFRKPELENSDRVPPGQHLVANGFPVLTYGDTPSVSIESWEFKVWGLAKPKTFTWSDFQAMPQSNFTADFHCVTRWSKLDVQWTGVKVTDFMKYIEVDPKAVHVLERCYGGYTTNIALADLHREENFFAHTLFGEPLSPDHGGPMRLVVPHLYGWKSAKWINGLEFTETEELGFWERNGYHRRGEPWAEERYSGLLELDDYSIVELLVPEEFDGKTISDLDLWNSYGLYLLAVSRGDKFEINPQPNERLRRGEVMVVLGSNKDINRFPI